MAKSSTLASVKLSNMADECYMLMQTGFAIFGVNCTAKLLYL